MVSTRPASCATTAVSSGGPICPTRSVLSALLSSPGSQRPTIKFGFKAMTTNVEIARSVVRPTPRVSFSRRLALKPSSPTLYVYRPTVLQEFESSNAATNRWCYRPFASVSGFSSSRTARRSPLSVRLPISTRRKRGYKGHELRFWKPDANILHSPQRWLLELR